MRLINLQIFLEMPPHPSWRTPFPLPIGWGMCLAFRRGLFSFSSPAGGEGWGEEAHRQVRLGLPPPPPSPPSFLAGRGRNLANTLNTYRRGGGTRGRALVLVCN